MYRKILNILDHSRELRQKSESFPQYDQWSDSEKSTLVDLSDTFNVSQGLGLAAPQIGIKKRAIIISPSRLQMDSDVESLVLINPTIEVYGETESGPEACFSVPGTLGNVTRQQSCKVSYTSIDGQKRVLEAEGFPAVCLQHEIDHLDGILYVDRMGPLSRKMLLKRLRKADARKKQAAKLAKASFDRDHNFLPDDSLEKKKTTHSKKRKPKARKPRPKKSKKRK